jgi:hypothetical protein
MGRDARTVEAALARQLPLRELRDRIASGFGLTEGTESENEPASRSTSVMFRRFVVTNPRSQPLHSDAGRTLHGDVARDFALLWRFSSILCAEGVGFHVRATNRFVGASVDGMRRP